MKYATRRLEVAAVVLLAGLPQVGLAQAGWSVAGRVVDAGSGAAVTNALVTLDGYGSVLSSERGLFRFESVRSGEHRLHVEALGYQDFAATMDVARDTILLAALDVRPIELDGIAVELRTLDFDGSVRDPRTESSVADADVRSDQGHEESSNLFGRFDLDDVFDGRGFA